MRSQVTQPPWLAHGSHDPRRAAGPALIRSKALLRAQRGSRRAISVLLFLVVLLSACGGPSAPPVAAPTSAAPTASLSVNPPTASPTVAPSPTATPAPVRWPLTGVLTDDPSKVKRRPLNVRFPNDRAARPQVGLAKADIVFEMIVEGGITRHSAIFHSQDAQGVGPVRSYRFSDLHITQMLRGALVASGATIEERDAVTQSIRDNNMISIDAQRGFGFYYRVAGRPGPNDLFANLEQGRQALNEAGGTDPVDVPALAFLRSAEHDPMTGGFATSQPASTLVIPFRDPATFTWDDGSKGYRRSQAGVRTVDPDGNAPINARNVIVIWTDIWETSVVQDRSGSLGLDYRMTGTGKAAVFRDGRRVDGTWKREGVLDMFAFYDQVGVQVLLSPGQSWFHFVYQDWVVTSEP